MCASGVGELQSPDWPDPHCSSNTVKTAIIVAADLGLSARSRAVSGTVLTCVHQQKFGFPHLTIRPFARQAVGRQAAGFRGKVVREERLAEGALFALSPGSETPWFLAEIARCRLSAGAHLRKNDCRIHTLPEAANPTRQEKSMELQGPGLLRVETPRSACALGTANLVQVSGRRRQRPVRMLERPASRKRQGTKSRSARAEAGSRALWGFQVGGAFDGGAAPGRRDPGDCAPCRREGGGSVPGWVWRASTDAGRMDWSGSG